MTSYFDKAGEDLHEAAKILDYGQRIMRFEVIEQKVVHDCTLAAMMPGFPVDLREAVHRTVLKHGVVTLPSNAPPADCSLPDGLTEDEMLGRELRWHFQRRADLVWDLHTVFHEVAQRGLDGFSDQPDVPVRRLVGLGEEEQYKLAAGEALPERADPLTDALAEVSRMRHAVAVAEGRVQKAFAAGAKWREENPVVTGPYQAIDAACDLYPYGLE